MIILTKTKKTKTEPSQKWKIHTSVTLNLFLSGNHDRLLLQKHREENGDEHN